MSPDSGRSRWCWSATSPGGCGRRSVASAVAVVATVAASSFVGTIGLRAARDGCSARSSLDVGSLLGVIAVAVLYDVLLTPFVLPPLMGMFRRLEPEPSGFPPDGQQLRHAQPAAPARHPGAGALAVRHPLRPALIPPGGLGRRLPGPGGLPVGPRRGGPAGARADRRRAGPAAGGQPHVVGDHGRPDAARQDARESPGRAAGADRRRRRSRRRRPPQQLVTCGDAGSVPGGAGTARPTSRCRSPRTSASGWRCGCSSSPRTSRPWSPSSRPSAPTPTRTASTPPTCSATSARSPRASTTAPARPATARSTARRRWAAPASRSSTTRGCAACPATAGSAVDSMGRVLGEESEIPGQPGDTLVTSIDAKVQGIVERQLAETIATARSDPRHRHRAQLRRRLGCRGGDGGRHRPHRRHGQPADVRPRGLGRRHHQVPARPALLGGGRDAAPRSGDPGAVRAGVDLEAVHDRRRADQRLQHRHPARTAPPASTSATGSSRTTSPAPTATSASNVRSRSPATPSSTASATTSGSGSAPTSTTSTPATRSSRRPRSSASATRPASTCRARRPAGSPTGSGSAPTGSR